MKFFLKNFYSINEVASFCEVGRDTIKNEIDRGKIEAVKIGGQYRIPQDSLKVYMGSLWYQLAEEYQNGTVGSELGLPQLQEKMNMAFIGGDGERVKRIQKNINATEAAKSALNDQVEKNFKLLEELELEGEHITEETKTKSGRKHGWYKGFEKPAKEDE